MDSKKTLVAVSDSCDKGNMLIFDNDGNFIVNRDSAEGKQIRKIVKQAKQKLEMYRKNGVYAMPVWIKDQKTSEKETPFHRPGM